MALTPTILEQPRPESDALPRDLLELYTKEAKLLDLLTPEEEKRVLGNMISVRRRWLSTFLGTEAALEMADSDLERWRRGELAPLSIITGPPHKEGEESDSAAAVAKLASIFRRHRRRHGGSRPFRSRAGQGTDRLVRALLFVGVRSVPLSRYREAALAAATKAQKRKIMARFDDFIEARSPLIVHNLRLVLKAARAFVPGPLPYSELVQEGNLGLIRATESFNDGFGVRFSTYAYLWIRQSIIRALENNSRTIRLPVSLTQRLRRLNQEVARHEAKGPNGESANRLAELMSNPSVAGTVLSLDFGQDDSATLGEGLADADGGTPEQAFTIEDLKQYMRGALHALPPRQRLVLRLRFGIGAKEPHSLSQIGRLLGLSAERIRQIQQVALKALRDGPSGEVLREVLTE